MEDWLKETNRRLGVHLSARLFYFRSNIKINEKTISQMRYAKL